MGYIKTLRSETLFSISILYQYIISLFIIYNIHKNLYICKLLSLYVSDKPDYVCAIFDSEINL